MYKAFVSTNPLPDWMNYLEKTINTTELEKTFSFQNL